MFGFERGATCHRLLCEVGYSLAAQLSDMVSAEISICHAVNFDGPLVAPACGLGIPLGDS
jgi:hypothetical protein